MTQEFQLAYYAHSKKKYGTKQEYAEYQFLKGLFYGLVICPNKHVGQLTGIEPYLDVVKRVDVVFVSEYNGYVGLGVFKECQHALKLDIPVFVMKPAGKNFKLEVLTSVDQVNYGSISLYGKLISKKYSPKKAAKKNSQEG